MSDIGMIDRRRMLQAAGCGFGWLAAQALFNRAAVAAPAAATSAATIPQPHFTPRAKRIIFLFMQGGPSQVDTFDHKPSLATHDGQMMPFDDARVLANSGKRGNTHRIMKSPWAFKQYGDCGHWVSELFPQTARHADDLCMIHSLHTEGVAHGPATLFLHCGATNNIRPSLGSWIHYGLGSENENLPGFVSIAPSMGNGGPRNFGNAFLPAIHQGTPIGSAGGSGSDLQLRNARVPETRLTESQQRLQFVQELNRQRLNEQPSDGQLEAMIRSYELAWRMQSHAPQVFDLADETATTLDAYGIGNPTTDTFGRRCLLARRMCEAGVRFIQVNYGDNSANPAWDQHSNLPKHADHAAAVDQPIAALLQDLKQRGLLDETVVWWGSEFGRTPYAQQNGTGRDHNPNGFTVWLAGAGVKPGYRHGETDEFGHQAVAKKVHMHDLHATLLHLLGLDHQRLTYEHAGRNFRLTDVYGRVVNEILV